MLDNWYPSLNLRRTPIIYVETIFKKILFSFGNNQAMIYVNQAMTIFLSYYYLSHDLARYDILKLLQLQMEPNQAFLNFLISGNF